MTRPFREHGGDDAIDRSAIEPRQDDKRRVERIERFKQFYRKAAPQLTAYLVVNERASEAAASEAAHEALVQYHWKMDSVASPMGWCRKAARSIFLGRLYSAEDSFADIPATGSPLYRNDGHMADYSGLREDDEQVSSTSPILPLVSQLPPKQRAVVSLIALEQRTPTEVAEELGIATATVRSHYRHALTRMRELHRQQSESEEG